MKIIVLGGDGFCGWPTALHLSKIGHDVVIVDNLSRRKIDIDLEVDSLTPIQPLGKRIQAWHEITGKAIRFRNIDVSRQYKRLLDLIMEEEADVIIHFAEQRSAPFSMKTPRTKMYTVNNNLNATNNVLCAIVESKRDIHLVHLGTMGVYGYSSAGMKIPEGYLTVHIHTDKGESIEKEILYPSNPGSIYHLTKTQDQQFFAYYNSNDGVRITDLHQGIVWGTGTEETNIDSRLINRFDYDGDYGTVLNRFLMQAAIDHPLTVHGTGGQTRAFIHIRDTVKCIELAIENPPIKSDRVQIYNQMTETHSIRDLASLVSRLSGSETVYLKNPRNEEEENELHVENKCLLDMGLNPTTLEEGLMTEIYDVAKKYSDRCDTSKIICRSYWTEDNKPEYDD
jgi:UDP-sulfoquinovose synthase